MKKSLRALVVVLAPLAWPVLVAAESWMIDPAHTLSGFTVRHLMVTNVRGAFDTTKGSIEYTPGDPKSVKAEIMIEARTVNTRNRKRDDHLRTNDFFDVEKFPTITFKSTRVENVRAGGFDLVGDLTIRDVTKEIVLKVDGPTAPIVDPQGHRRLGASATTSISRKDFGVSWHRTIETGGVVVGDEVKIEIDVQVIEKKG